MTGSSLLLNERPLYALPRLASFLGSMDDAVVLQQTFWLCQNPEYHRLITHTDDDGLTWVLLTNEHARQLYFMWLKKDALKRINRRLIKEGLMQVRRDLNAEHNPDKRQHSAPWYNVNGERVKSLAEPVERVRALSETRSKAALSGKRGCKMHPLSDDEKGMQNAPPLGDQNAPPFTHLSTELSTEFDGDDPVLENGVDSAEKMFDQWHQLIQRSADAVLYKTVFSALRLVEYSAPSIVLATHNKHHLSRLQEQYMPMLTQTLHKLVDFEPQVTVIHRDEPLSTIVSSENLKLAIPQAILKTEEDDPLYQEVPVPEKPSAVDIASELDKFGFSGEQVDIVLEQRPDLGRVPGYIAARYEQAQSELKLRRIERYTTGLLVHRLVNPHMYSIHRDCKDCGVCKTCVNAWSVTT